MRGMYLGDGNVLQQAAESSGIARIIIDKMELSEIVSSPEKLWFLKKLFDKEKLPQR